MGFVARKPEEGRKDVEEFVYDPDHPLNKEARLMDDTSQGIDWDEIIATTEADWQAGRYYSVDTDEDLDKLMDEWTADILAEYDAKQDHP